MVLFYHRKGFRVFVSFTSSFFFFYPFSASRGEFEISMRMHTNKNRLCKLCVSVCVLYRCVMSVSECVRCAVLIILRKFSTAATCII